METRKQIPNRFRSDLGWFGLDMPHNEVKHHLNSSVMAQVARFSPAFSVNPWPIQNRPKMWQLAYCQVDILMFLLLFKAAIYFRSCWWSDRVPPKKVFWNLGMAQKHNFYGVFSNPRNFDVLTSKNDIGHNFGPTSEGTAGNPDNFDPADASEPHCAAVANTAEKAEAEGEPLHSHPRRHTPSQRCCFGTFQPASFRRLKMPTA